jgi:ubiquinone/menaquinone biosynthesis C-methylase UbiE
VKISEAIALIHTPLIEWARPQSWCDLGCGSGTFTTALAQLLAPGSMIHAVDLDPRVLEYVPDHYDGVEIRKTLGISGVPASAFHRSMEFSWQIRCTLFKSSMR